MSAKLRGARAPEGHELLEVREARVGHVPRLSIRRPVVEILPSKNKFNVGQLFANVCQFFQNITELANSAPIQPKTTQLLPQIWQQIGNFSPSLSAFSGSTLSVNPSVCEMQRDARPRPPSVAWGRSPPPGLWGRSWSYTDALLGSAKDLFSIDYTISVQFTLNLV